MSTRNEIIDNIRQRTIIRYDMPELELIPITYSDLHTQFKEVSRSVGGSAVELKEGEDINNLISTLYPDAVHIASNIKGINLATINPDEIEDPHQLNKLDLAIIEGEIGVAENGCVWIPQRVRQKVIYFIAEKLVILLDKEKLVPTMHDAYAYIGEEDYGFGVFISGPSKTADIEQALVVGAHGAREVMVILK